MNRPRMLGVGDGSGASASVMLMNESGRAREGKLTLAIITHESC